MKYLNCVRKMTEEEIKKIIREFIKHPKPFRLIGSVMHYDWGGYSMIPTLLAEENKYPKPYAELWLGAHSNHPSIALLHRGDVPLDRLIAAAPGLLLGQTVAERFHGKLPYLLKVLDARDILSIQVHPSKKQAEKGFTAENKAGIPIDAPKRNYKDANHKPEAHITLTKFWMLHGFKRLEEISKIIEGTPEFVELAQAYSKRLSKPRNDALQRRRLLKDFYNYIMQMDQNEVDRILGRLLSRIMPLYEQGQLRKDDPNFWAARADKTFPHPGGGHDRGIFSIYLMNLVHLHPGQGSFQPAGVPHAYLAGTTIELMTNSDNVIRGGLSSKYIDVKELMKTLSFVDKNPSVFKLKTVSETEQTMPAAVEDFFLSRINIHAGACYKSEPRHGPDILILTAGLVWISSSGDNYALKRGDSLFVPADIPYEISSKSETVLFKATVPDTISGIDT